jgi:hypothetical protein
MALEGFQFPSSARRFWCLLADVADKPDHEREIDSAMHSSGLEFAVARPIPISGNRVMSGALAAPRLKRRRSRGAKTTDKDLGRR